MLLVTMISTVEHALRSGHCQGLEMAAHAMFLVIVNSSGGEKPGLIHINVGNFYHNVNSFALLSSQSLNDLCRCLHKANTLTTVIYT